MATATKRPKLSHEVIRSANKTKKAAASSTQFDMNWDVDYYKTDFECDEHWELRRSFMETHKDKFSEEKLVCLAQVFVNVEFMGCKYPAETMRVVGELSQDVAKEFRAERASRLKRTFVTASNAAEQRAKGRVRRTDSGAAAKSTMPFTSTIQSNPFRQHFATGEYVDLYKDLKYGKFIVYLSGQRNCLRQSAGMAQMSYEERESARDLLTVTAEIVIGKFVVGSGSAENIKSAKAAAHQNALRELQRECYSIKLNSMRDTVKLEKSNNQVEMNVTKEATTENLLEKKLDETNKGFRLMRLMGWTGGGLGSRMQGRKEPVPLQTRFEQEINDPYSYLLKNSRLGLGSAKPAKENYARLLANYAKSDDIRDLQFGVTFTKDERANLHVMANRFQLRSCSYGVGEERRLVITKKISNQEIIEQVLVHRTARFCSRYFVQVPESKAELFPAHATMLELEC